MDDYRKKLKDDLLEQFRGKHNINVLMDALGRQLQEVYEFYEQLRKDRGVKTAVGKQLDGVGDIVVLSRMEAGRLAGNPIPFDILDDETYRQYLVYKILKNTCDCTYPDIIKAFRMFWDRPLYYSEDPAQPATMIFDTGEMQGNVDTRPLFRTPLLRAAGVTLKIYARTSTPMKPAILHILTGLGYAVTISTHPIIERDYDFLGKLYVGSGNQSISEDFLPGVERDFQFDGELHIGTVVQNVMQGIIPNIDRDIPLQTSIDAGSTVHSVMETPLGDIAEFK